MRLIVVALLLMTTQDPPNDPNDGADSSEPKIAVLRERAGKLIETSRKLDWDTQYEYMMDAIDRVYDRNGWNNESDLFTLELTYEVEALPPWAIQQRLDLFVEMVGDRYLLDEDQAGTLRNLVIRDSVSMFKKHSGRIMQYAVDVISTRAAGEPFTAEQVARWTKLAHPVFQDARRMMMTSGKDFLEVLDPEQRELVQADIDATERRLDTVDPMFKKWMAGKWEAAEWGMDQDPIQMAGVVDAEEATRDSSANPGKPRPAARNEPTRTTNNRPADGGAQPDQPRAKPTGSAPADDPWSRYVRAFIGKYRLQDAQQQKAWLFYRDAKQRARMVVRRYERQVGDLKAPDSERSKAVISERTAQRTRDEQRLFDRLKQRLERLPTRTQRKQAEPDSDPSNKTKTINDPKPDQP